MLLFPPIFVLACAPSRDRELASSPFWTENYGFFLYLSFFAQLLEEGKFSTDEKVLIFIPRRVKEGKRS